MGITGKDEFDVETPDGLEGDGLITAPKTLDEDDGSKLGDKDGFGVGVFVFIGVGIGVGVFSGVLVGVGVGAIVEVGIEVMVGIGRSIATDKRFESDPLLLFPVYLLTFKS